MRKLKHHEKKLLKKVDFLQWKREHQHRELEARPCPFLSPSVRLLSAATCCEHALQCTHEHVLEHSEPEAGV